MLFVSSNTRATIDAALYVDRSDSIVLSAALLGTAVVDTLAAGRDVLIKFNGLPAVSSSYFNMLISTVLHRHSLDVFDHVIQMEFGSPAQEEIWKRSFQAALKDG